MKSRQSESKKQRRAYEAYLKKYDPEKYREWKAGAIERGRKLHEANVEAVKKLQEENFEKMQSRIIENLRNEGKTSEEIDEYINDWSQTIKFWASREKPKRWKDIIKQKSKKL